MKDQRKQPSHFVQVARLRIETTIIGIDADVGANDAGVEREAIETASSLAEALIQVEDLRFHKLELLVEQRQAYTSCFRHSRVFRIGHDIQ